MYAHSFFTTSVRGSGLAPTISAREGDGVISFMNAAFGLRFAPADFFAAGFFAAVFLAAILVKSPPLQGTLRGFNSEAMRPLGNTDREEFQPPRGDFPSEPPLKISFFACNPSRRRG